METAPLSPTGRRSRFDCCAPQQNDGLRIIVFAFGVLCICITIALVISIHFGQPEIPPKGAVATDDPECSRIGIDVLLKGGNAIDAAVACTLCMCVVHPHMTSFGGGGVMVVLNHLASKQPEVVNFQNSALDPVDLAAITSGLEPASVGAPSLVSGLWEAHRKHGKTKWADLVKPAIDLAEKGFSVSIQLANATQNLGEDAPLRRSELFFPNNVPLAEGRVLRNPALANLLKAIAVNGSAAFYEGDRALSLVNYMVKRGVPWTVSKLQSVSKPRFERPVSGTLGKSTIFASSAPTSGPQLISLLNIISGFDYSKADQWSVKYFHDLIESIRYSQNQAAFLGDPQFSPVVNNTVNAMTNKNASEAIRKQFVPNSFLPDRNFTILNEASACVVSVMDNEENYVTIVSGLNTMFGSQIETPDGYLLNNAMSNFHADFNASVNLGDNAGQRPVQGMLAAIVTETSSRCGTRFVTGGADASLVAQVVFNVLQLNQTVEEAVRRVRLHTQATNHVLRTEDVGKLPSTVQDSLMKMGLQIVKRESPYPSINIVIRNNDVLDAQSDARGGGQAVKYGRS